MTCTCLILTIRHSAASVVVAEELTRSTCRTAKIGGRIVVHGGRFEESLRILLQVKEVGRFEISVLHSME